VYAILLSAGCAKPADRIVAVDAPDSEPEAGASTGEVRAGADDVLAAPPYDLAADVAARTVEARSLLGAIAAITVVQQMFVVVSPRPGAHHAAAVKLASQALDAWYHGRFSRRPERALGVFVFPDRRSYAAFLAKRLGDSGAPADALGFYDHVERLVVVDGEAGLTTLTHELVHAVVAADFPGRPAWLNEGLGALYESPVFPSPGEIHGASNWRHAQLVAALRSPAERPRAGLERLFGMSDAEFLGPDLYLHYAMARELCRWLDERGELWAFYAAWRDGVDDDVTGEKAFERVVGMTPVGATAQWQKWVLAQ
jgi:hypothetical protein